MNKTASRFLNRTGISPSAIGLGPKNRMRARIGGQVVKLEQYMRACGCDDAVIYRFRDHLHSGKRPGFAVAVAIREMRPELYKRIRRQPGAKPNWTFKKLLKDYAGK